MEWVPHRKERFFCQKKQKADAEQAKQQMSTAFMDEKKLFAGPHTWAKQESKHFPCSPRLYKSNLKLNDALFPKDKKITTNFCPLIFGRRTFVFIKPFISKEVFFIFLLFFSLFILFLGEIMS